MAKTINHIMAGLLALCVSAPTAWASVGFASWYGPGFHGKRTASGHIFNQHRMTAAHKRLPFGTKVRVTNLRTHKSAIVRITDRGPFIKGRVIDLSKAAAKAIGMAGVDKVKLTVLSTPTHGKA